MIHVKTDGNPVGFEYIHDLGNIGLDMRRGVIIEKKEKVQQEAADLGRKLFILDLIQPVFQFS
jgi:hypothetical protein